MAVCVARVPSAPNTQRFVSSLTPQTPDRERFVSAFALGIALWVNLEEFTQRMGMLSPPTRDGILRGGCSFKLVLEYPLCVFYNTYRTRLVSSHFGYVYMRFLPRGGGWQVIARERVYMGTS